MKIISIDANWVGSSELGKSVGVWIKTDKGEFVGYAPEGTSAGKYEAKLVLVNEAVKNIQAQIPHLVKSDPSDLKSLDNYLIELGGHQMQRFGGNASVALSSAWAKMAAATNGKTVVEYLAEYLGTQPKLPLPAFNVINGGFHGALDKGGKPYNPIQEIMIVPAGAVSFEQDYDNVITFFKELRKVSGETLVGKEGGFSPAKPLEASIDMVAESIEKAGFRTDDFRLAIDAAASEFYDETTGLYLPVKKGKELDVGGMISFYSDLIKKSPVKIFSLEDPLAEHDFDGFAQLKKEFKEKKYNVILIGDDLYVTQKERVKTGVEKDSTDGVLIKINQNGTVTGTLDTIRYGLDQGLLHMISHRSKRVPGDLINAYLAVAVGQMIKHGSSRGERVEMYNELLKLERDAEGKLPYASKDLIK